MPVEEIIYWSEEELKAEAVKPSKEELEYMQSLLNQIHELLEDATNPQEVMQQEDFQELYEQYSSQYRALLEYKMYAWKWMYEDLTVIEHLLYGLELPSRLEQYKKIAVHLYVVKFGDLSTPEHQIQALKYQSILTGLQQFMADEDLEQEPAEIIQQLIEHEQTQQGLEDAHEEVEEQEIDIEDYYIGPDIGYFRDMNSAYHIAHQDLNLEEVGEANHSINATGYISNDQWYLNRTVDDDWLGYTIESNDTTLRYIVKTKDWYYARLECRIGPERCRQEEKVGNWSVSLDIIFYKSGNLVTNLSYYSNSSSDISFSETYNYSKGNLQFTVMSRSD